MLTRGYRSRDFGNEHDEMMTMRIQDIETILIEIPLKKDFGGSTYIPFPLNG